MIWDRFFDGFPWGYPEIQPKGWKQGWKKLAPKLKRVYEMNRKPLILLLGDPKGTRTPVTGVRGP